MKLISSFIFPIKSCLFMSKVVSRHIIFTVISNNSSNTNVYIYINISVMVVWFLTTDSDFD
jgi:hypothetical protein